jgi:hypothetical protein
VNNQAARNEDQAENAGNDPSPGVGFDLPRDVANGSNEKKSQTHEYNDVTNWLIYQMLE